MKIFELDNNLKPNLHRYDINVSNETIASRTFLFPLCPNIYSVKGFIDYACFCYKNHYGFVISPTDIMYMVQAELAMAVKNNPDAYSSMFTTTPGEKQEIITLTGNVEEIDVLAVVDALRYRVPTKIDLFLPEFSTTTSPANLASHIAFCDMVSPYYSYSTMLCGIPRVKIAGDIEDWQKLAKTLFDLSALFSGKLKSYLGRVWSRTTSIIKEHSSGNGDLFLQMVKMRPCGSGSQQEVDGWILDFMNTPRNPPVMLQNVHQHVSVMTYKNLETNRTFNLYSGLFYCELHDDFAKPSYNANRIETTVPKKETKSTGNTKNNTEPFEINLVSSPIVTQTKKLPVEFTIDPSQDIQTFHSRDAEDALLGAIHSISEENRQKKKTNR